MHVIWTVRVVVSSAILGAYFGGLVVPTSVQAAPCSNEAIRIQQGTAQLPECRAYELASNFPKQGDLVSILPRQGDYPGNEQISGPAVGFSEDGERISVMSLAAGLGVLGQERTAFGSGQFLRRNEGSGWSAEPLNPPQSQFSDQKLIVSDANTGTSLWLLHTSDTGSYTGDLYVRLNTGQFELIGPETPGGAPEPASPTMIEVLGSARDTDGVVGASRGFTHIILNANTSLSGRFLWPGDTTFREPTLEDERSTIGSLYEYSGEANPGETDREPVLIGVKGGLGNTELIGECGTTLGTLKQERSIEPVRKQAPSEISEDGDVVFFSPIPADVTPLTKFTCDKKQPEKQELYARLDQSESVDVSEPTPSECGTDLECAANAAIPADADFEAASSDGSKVFFTSTQQLLPGATEDPEASDSARTGCPKTTEGMGGCNLYEYDFGSPGESLPPGEHLQLVSAGSPHGAEVQGVIGSAKDGSHVYFVAKGNLTGTEQNSAGKEAVEGKDNLYVYEPDPENPGESVVMFIATLSPEDAASLWKTEQPEARVTPNGDFLVFESHERLTKDDSSVGHQLFEYDALTKALARISISEKIEGKSYGANGNVESGLESPGLGLEESGVSNDGRVVAFGSRAALSPRAVTGSSSECPSVYEYSWNGSRSITEGEVRLISDGKDVVLANGNECQGAAESAVDGSGEDVLFETADPLTWEDGDTLGDVYDARVDGGRLPPAQVGCSGDGCQQSPVSSQAEGALASELVRNGENNMPATPPVVSKAKAGVLTRVQRLAKALKACEKKPRAKHRRAMCEKRARKLYGGGK